MSASQEEIIVPSSRVRLPWHTVLRAPMVCSAIPPLVLAALGILAYWGGANVLDRLLGGSEPSASTPLFPQVTDPSVWSTESIWAPPASYLEAIIEPGLIVLRPFLSFFSGQKSAFERCHFLLLGLWSIIVWGIFGAAIARSVMIALTRGTGQGAISSLGFSLGRIPSLIGPPLAPILIVIALGLPGIAIGLIGRLPGLFGGIAAFLGFIPLLFGLAMATILLGVAVGWPLIATTIAAEGEDGFDALSRTYSYVNRRPFLYLLLLTTATLGGIVGLVVAKTFVLVAFGLAEWGLRLSNSSPETILAFWRPAGSVALLAWSYSHFWAALSIIYLRLRFVIDGTSPDEIAEETQEVPSTPPFVEVPAGPEITKG